MNQFIEILSYFIIYSFLGWVIESVYKTTYQKKFINSGFLHGPFCPIYGIGALIMFFCLRNFKGSPIIVFILGFIVLSIWEYLVGFLLEKLFNTKYWDYSDSKYNIHGRVCLLNSIFWGILGLIFIEFVHPFVQEKLALVAPNTILYSTIIISIYLVVDCIITVIKINNIDASINKLEEINVRIKEKLEEIKEIGKGTNINAVENAKVLLEDLKEKKNKIDKKLYKNVYRLKKAFPTMKSDKFTKILELKNELKRDKKHR